MSSSASAGEPLANGRGARSRVRPWWRPHFQRRIELAGMAFVAPTLLFFAAFKYGPMLWAIGLSFTSYDMVSTPQFVGLENYHNLVADPVFRVTLVNTLVYVIGSTVLITVAALLLALAINTGVPGARHCMAAMFLTNLMPIIAVCLVWRFLFHPFGLVNQLLSPFGFGRIDWLDRKSTRLNSSHLVISYAV